MELIDYPAGALFIHENGATYDIYVLKQKTDDRVVLVSGSGRSDKLIPTQSKGVKFVKELQYIGMSYDFEECKYNMTDGSYLRYKNCDRVVSDGDIVRRVNSSKLELRVVRRAGIECELFLKGEGVILEGGSSGRFYPGRGTDAFLDNYELVWSPCKC